MKTVPTSFANVPEANARSTGEEIRGHDDVEVSLAIASYNRLIIPVVRAVNQMNINKISDATEDLIARVRLGSSKQNEIGSVTFSVTNGGMYGDD